MPLLPSDLVLFGKLWCGMPWLLIFFLTPIAEMYLLMEVAGYIDVWPTIFLVMLTAVIGVALLKRQGLATLTRGMARLQSGQLPAREMAEGILLAVAGALLVTPGFVTDFVGFTLLFPPSRAYIAALMLKNVHVQGMGPGMGPGNGPDDLFTNSGSSGFPPGAKPTGSSTTHATPPGTKKPSSGHEPVVIEGDFERRK